MTAAPVAVLPHPLTVGVAELAGVLDRMPIGGWDGLDEDTLAPLVTELMRIGARVKAHQAAAARVLDETGLAKRSGASSTGALLAQTFGGDQATTTGVVRTGRSMQTAPQVEEALASGVLTERQARVIADSTRTVPETHRRRAQATLINDAQTLTIKDLQRRADRINDIHQPKPKVDEDENTTLQDRERRAYASATFRMWDKGDGTHAGEFRIPEAQADILRTTLQALTAPRRNHGDDAVPVETPTTTKLGQAFARLAGKLTPETIIDGGPTLVVTVDLATLQGTNMPATLDTGTRISAGVARRLACDTGILPAVMDGRSTTLDLGRQRRLFTKNQRIAMGLRDRGCAFPGCDRPPQWCEAHHWRQPWAAGGTTDLDDGVLLCSHHHHVVHDQRWTLRRGSDGIIEFQAPGTTGWQRNHRYRP